MTVSVEISVTAHDKDGNGLPDSVIKEALHSETAPEGTYFEVNGTPCSALDLYERICNEALSAIHDAI